MAGFPATERLSPEWPPPAVGMMAVRGEGDYHRRSILAGAREFLVKPFSSDELSASIRQVYARERDKATRMVLPTAATPSAAGRGPARRGQIVAFFSPKGGVGRTTMAVNVAVAAAADLGR